MLPEQQHTLIFCLQAAVAGILPDAAPQILLERPKIAAHGDLATNVAMQLAKPNKRNPRELAQAILDALMANPVAREIVAQAELAGPGFINFRLTHAARSAVDDHDGSEQQGTAGPRLLVPSHAQLRRAGEGAHGPEDHLNRVEGERQDRRRAEQARQVHRVLLVRVDVDAGQPQPAP